MQGVRTNVRAVLAGVTVLGVAAGCGVLPGGGGGGLGDGTATVVSSAPAVAAATGNPWDLPLEQRPPLFDPCTEIPESALREAGFSPDMRKPELTMHKPGEGMACAWGSSEVVLTVVAGWRTPSEVRALYELQYQGPVKVAQRGAEMYFETGDGGHRTITNVFYTGRGSIYISTDSVSALREFKGAKFTDARIVFEETVNPVVEVFPEGDFR